MPAIMSGRDVIGIAKTGSGKTLAFVLPMIRHIMDQPPLEEGDGPVGMQDYSIYFVIVIRAVFKNYIDIFSVLEAIQKVWSSSSSSL